MSEKVLMVDSHCHLNFDSYNDDRDAVIERAAAAGVSRIIIPAVDMETCEEAMALAAKHEGIFAAVGVHPNSTAEFEPSMIERLREWSKGKRVISIGEIGLDYYWDKSPKAKQFEAFEAQLALAAELQLPVIIHNREADEDVIAILDTWVKSLPETMKARLGVLHSFSAPLAIAERALDLGFYLGFTGPITFKKAEDLRAVARQVPLERLLVETDGPFLTPEPYRGKLNSPEYIPFIVDRLAALHGISTEEMGRITTENAISLFGI
jgi:TatD DNase family protein